MVSVVYVSSATRDFSDADLLALLAKARQKNASLDITGMLLHKGGNFMQVLEGPDESVRDLLETIRADDRHSGVIRLLERLVDTREFPDWTMAFRNLNDPDVKSTPGYSEFLNQPLYSEKFQTDPNHARKLLETFRRAIR